MTAAPGTFSIDLHIHTHFSDGKQSPEEIFHLAAQLGITTLALTDHDNANAVRMAAPLSRDLGITLIPAIELTCRWDECDPHQGDRDVDVLGYFINPDDADWLAFERAALADAHARIRACCDLVTASGYPITLDDLFVENPRYGGLLHMIHVLQHQFGLDWDTAASVVLDRWQEVRQSSLNIQDGIAHIHRAGGVAVLAHPTTLKCAGGWVGEKQLASLVEMGLDGIEIYHYRVGPDAQIHFVRLADHFHLLISGGADHHGWWPGDNRLGTQPLTADIVTALYARHLDYTHPVSGQNVG